MHPKRYVICTHPRSGSNYFCELLKSTRKLGYPDEYFHTMNLKRAGLNPDSAADLARQYQYLIDQTSTDNGVVGLKLFYFDIHRLENARLLDGLSNFTHFWLLRKDKVAQAISIRRALNTGQLTSDHPASNVLVDYDYQDIRLRLLRVIQAEKNWAIFFESRGIKPIYVSYEELAADPQHIIDKVTDALGMSDATFIDTSALRLKVQRDAVNQEWHARFIKEARQRDPRLINDFV